MSYTIARQGFPQGEALLKFIPMWIAHGQEVAGKPMELDLPRYRRLQDEGRLIWIVAFDDDQPIGYSSHFWYRDLHFNERIAADDIWYVKPSHRGKGVGRELKRLGLMYLRKAGVVKTYDLIRGTEHSPTMENLGYKRWGTRWIHTL